MASSWEGSYLNGEGFRQQFVLVDLKVAGSIPADPIEETSILFGLDILARTKAHPLVLGYVPPFPLLRIW